MSLFSFAPLLLVLSLFALRTTAIPTSYANAFVDPRWILAKSAWNVNGTEAQEAITSGAHDYALQGPWSTTNKTIMPPTNNTRDYFSFAPYWWPNCTNVHNTTELTTYQVWTECIYRASCFLAVSLGARCGLEEGELIRFSFIVGFFREP